jgi:carboxyl-terminal processing protease
MNFMNKILLFLLLSFVLFGESCKKDKSSAPTGSTLDLVRDSVFLYAKEDYYWYDALPTSSVFNPRSFTATADIDALTKEVNAISQYKINPATNKPYEASYDANGNITGEAKYSFIDEGEVSTKLNAVTGDFGFAPLYNATNDLRVKYVYPGSPADLAGIKRGYQITAINGQTNLTYDGTTTSTNVNFIVNAYSNSSSITMTLLKPDGTSFNVSLTAAVYTINPVITSKVIDLGNGKKVGYIVFNSFVILKNAQPQIDAAFNTFKTAGVTDLVVDLRYNGGGYVETAEYLDNQIAPSTTNNSLMYTAYYNNTLTAGKAVLLKNQVRKDDNGNSYNYGQVDFSVAGNQTKFGTAHPLNLNRVFFIVTGSTASASELTINNLRPYMNVQLVGRTTYGKPVGFFDIDINKYQMYIPEFETKNSAGQGGYYTGMVPASTDYPGYNAADDPTKDFGDVTERLLASVLSDINSGVYKVTSASVESLNAKTTLSVDQQTALSSKMDNDKFKGMLYKNPKHK